MSIEMNDVDLLAYLDGTLDATRAEEVEQSSAARQRAATLDQLQTQLKRRLYRAECPETLALAEYEMDLLPAGRAQALTAHVDACPHCARELEATRAFLKEVASDLEYSFLARVKVLIARLVPDGFGGDPLGPALGTPAFAVRGGDTGPLLYEADDVQVTVEVQADADRPGRKTILGLVLGAETAGWQAHLWRDGARTAGTAVDELGNFTFSGLEPATYALIVGGDDVEIHVPELEV